MKKNIIVFLFASLGLMACDKENTSFNVSTTIEKSDGENTKVTVTESSNNGVVVTGNNNAIAIGNDSVAINDNGSTVTGMVNGQEINIDSSGGGVSISYVNGEMLINGKKPEVKETSSKNKVDIKLTGKQIKIPINTIKTINSSYKIEQKCSDDGKSYLIVDEALKPYLSEDLNKGVIRLKNGTYNIDGKPEFILLTHPLEKIDVQSGKDVTLGCTNKNNFVLENTSLTTVTVTNLESKEVSVENSGTGKIHLAGEHIDKLTAVNHPDLKVEASWLSLSNKL